MSALALLVLLASACAEGRVPEQSSSESERDAGGTDAGDEQPDGGQEPTTMTPTLAPSGGGAHVESGDHKIRLIVGPRGERGTLESGEHRIQMGAGNVQHGQDRVER